MTIDDLLVIGGGPVGLASAIEGRLRDLTVTVIEPHTGVLDKACGEGLMPGALPFLQRLGVDPEGASLLGVRYSDQRYSVTHRFSSGAGRGVRRTVLHDALLTRALHLGVKFEHTSLETLTQDEDKVSVHCADGREVVGRYLIGADGLHSKVARVAGMTKKVNSKTTRRFGIRQHFAVAPWSDCIEVFYTQDAEVYITPVSSTEIGVAVLGRRNTDYSKTIEKVHDLQQRIKGLPGSSQKFGAGSFPQKTSKRQKGRILLVGDASGYVDAITGEGLRLGFAQANLAVRLISEKKPEAYGRSWTRVTRDFRVLTRGLTLFANSNFRTLIVPLATRFPSLFGLIVERLAR